MEKKNEKKIQEVCTCVIFFFSFLFQIHGEIHGEIHCQIFDSILEYLGILGNTYFTVILYSYSV